jgi:hypothetical protein
MKNGRWDIREDIMKSIRKDAMMDITLNIN